MNEKRKNYLSWDESFMQIAKVISQRSKDPSTQVGAVIVDDRGIVVGLGYNGFPRGTSDDDLPWNREGQLDKTKYAYIVHAEENAVYNANRSVAGCKMYSTLFPCNECVKTLIQTGIKEIIFESDKYHDDPTWVAARKMLDMAKIKYRQYTSEYELNLEKKHG